MTALELPELQMCLFPLEGPTGIGGALVHNTEFYRPSHTEGPLLYLNGNPDVQIVLDRVPGAGGKILVPKTLISPEYGHMAVFLDTEGNRVGLHSIPANRG